MSQDHRRVYVRGAFVSVVNMYVRSADAAGGDLYHDFIRFRLPKRHFFRSTRKTKEWR